MTSVDVEADDLLYDSDGQPLDLPPGLPALLRRLTESADRKPRKRVAKSAESGALLDAAAIVRELGVTRAAAEAIMRELPKVHPPGAVLRKVFVRRTDLDALLRSWEVAP